MTGREVLLKTIVETGSISQSEAERLISAIYSTGYVCVPREPTAEMLKAAWAEALGEDAAGVWSSMIDESEGLTKSEEEILKEARQYYRVCETPKTCS